MTDTSTRTVAVGLGGASLGNHRRAFTDDEAHALLDAAWQAGIRHFDTAPHYGLGLSERRLGDFLADKPRHEFSVSTKVGRLLEPQDPAGQLDDEGFLVPAHSRRTWDFSVDGVRRSLEGSLERLRLDTVETTYLHDPERWRLDEGLAAGLEGLLRLRDDELTQQVGVGSMSVDALAAAAAEPAFDDLMVAGRLTVLDGSAAAEVLPRCVANSTDVTAAAVLNGGLLAAARIEDSTFDYAAPGDRVLHRARRVLDVCRHHDVPAGAVALQFPRRFPQVRRLVIGAEGPGQLREALEWLSWPVPEPVWAELDVPAGRP